MSIRTILIIVGLTAVHPAVAGAACNVIPQSAPGFRGVRGHIDRPFAVGGDAGTTITLRAECGSPAFVDANGDAVIDASDVTIGFFARAASGDPVIIPGDSDCAAARLRYGSSIKCVRPNQVDLVMQTVAGDRLLTLKPPKAGFAGPTSVAVVAVDTDFPAGLKGGCAAATLGAANICIDDLLRSDTCIANDADPNFAAFVLLSKWNEYQEICTSDFGVNPKCKGTADAVVSTLDLRGDVFVPMKWDKILRLKKNLSDFDRRLVRGSTAIEAFKGGNAPIAIPGSEFLEALDATGLLFTQRPLFVPVNLSDRGNELTLFGNADKTRSVLRISRRKLWAYACAGGVNVGQACSPSPQDNEYEVDCPDSPCAQTVPPRYYFCDQGSRKGLPCVRALHCPAGKCVAGSTCQSGPYIGTRCERDSICAPGECGAGLFDLRDRAADHVLEIKRTAGKFDGVCDGGTDDGDRCSATCYNFPLSFNSCVSYRGEAVIYAP